ncbi:MAG TPA: trigger factor [Vicinamibacterales bacterium]|nr:trigger factor [Vicinamibacterales bacterium]
MKSEIVDVNETRRDLTIEVPTDVVAEAIGQATKKLGRAAKIPGFRPGKVPANVIRQRFKPQIMQDVAEHLVSKAVGDALIEKGVEPIATPDIQDLVLEEGKPLTFKASFDVVPAFDPGDLSTIEATEPSRAIEDEAVNQSLERIRERNARYEAVESGAVEAGHTVVVALERHGTDKEGKPGEVEKHEQVNIELGAPSNPPGFDAEVIGMAPGTSKNFTITYPDDYTIPELAGGKVDYTVNLKEIKKRVIPALDDELAKDLGDFSSLEELRKRVREDLEHEAMHAAEREVRQDVMKQLATRVPFAVPTSLVEREIDRRLEDFARRLMDQRIDPRQANIDWNAFREGQRAPATEAVASALVLDEIAKRDQIEVTAEDLDTELQRYADQTGHNVASIRARLQKDGELGRLAAGLRREKTVAHVMAKAKVTRPSS